MLMDTQGRKFIGTYTLYHIHACGSWFDSGLVSVNTDKPAGLHNGVAFSVYRRWGDSL
jgi:hypothetical protein